MIDTHTHLFAEEFKDDLSEVIKRALENGVQKMFLPNIDACSVEPMMKVCNTYKDICYPLIGLHPTDVKEDYASQLAVLKEYSDKYNFSGIGEVGLDYYWDTTFKNEQIEAFETQVNWAINKELPIIIHAREAFDDLYDIMCKYKGTRLKGIFHSFTGNEEEATKLLEFNNFMLGINGVVTFKKSELGNVLKQVPLSRLVLETDSPYLAPVPFRGRRNETSYIIHIANKISEIYNITLAEVEEQTTINASTIFF